MSEKIEAAMETIAREWPTMSAYDKGYFIGRMEEKSERNRQQTEKGKGAA